MRFLLQDLHDQEFLDVVINRFNARLSQRLVLAYMPAARARFQLFTPMDDSTKAVSAWAASQHQFLIKLVYPVSLT